MTPNQIETVKDSFQQIYPIKDALSQTFYDELFHIAPSVRPFFAEDMTEQRIKLSETLGAVVNNLHQLPLIADTVTGLARRHVSYGAKPEHFAPVGHALIFALEKHMPGGLTEVETDAWVAAYTQISDLMPEAMLLYDVA